MDRNRTIDMSDDVEILAHITAPAMAADDARYRALASACLSFTPASRMDIFDISVAQDSPIAARVLETTGEKTTRPSVPISSSQGWPSFIQSSFNSAELSFSSACDNANSPRLRDFPARMVNQAPFSQLLYQEASEQLDSQDVATQELPDSSQQPPSTVEDSLPFNTTTLAGFSSPSRMIEHFLGDFGSSQFTSSQSLDGQAGDAPHQLAPSDAHLTIPGTPSPPPALPVITGVESSQLDEERLPPSPLLGKRKAPPVSGSETSVIEETTFVVLETPNTSTHAAVPSTDSRADSEPPPSKRQKGASSSLGVQVLIRSSSDRVSVAQPTVENAFERGRALLKDYEPRHLETTELWSPEPPVSCESVSPENLLTPNLRKLATDLEEASEVPPRSRFNPVELVGRSPEPFERGYWLVDCSDWEDGLAKLAWCYLANYVAAKGFAGWGTWCKRDEEWGWIRVYCFGYVTKHIYLLLYAASCRELKRTGAKWIDGGGDVVLLMEGT